MKAKRESEVAQSCLTLRDPMDYSLPGSSIHGIFQARVLEWDATAFSPTPLKSLNMNLVAVSTRLFTEASPTLGTWPEGHSWLWGFALTSEM